MSVQQVQQNVKPTVAAVPQMSTERHYGTFSQVTALPLSFSIKPNDTATLYRARMDNRDVVLRVLKGKLSCTRLTTAKCLAAELVSVFTFFFFNKKWSGISINVLIAQKCSFCDFSNQKDKVKSLLENSV